MTLYDTLKIEFSVRNSRFDLNESYGILPRLMKFLDHSYDKITSALKDHSAYDEIIYVDNPLYINNIKTNGPVFPKTVKFHVRYIKSDPNPSIEARYDGIDDDGISIFIDMRGYPIDVFPRIKPTIAHELTHAYEDFNRVRKNPTLSLMSSLRDMYKVGVLVKQNWPMFNKVTVDFADCCYWLSPFERNANLGSLETELEPYLRKIYDERSAERYIKEIPLYKEYEIIKKKLSNIKRNSLSIQKDLDDNIDDLGMSVKDISRLINQLEDFMEDFECKLFRNAANIAYMASRDGMEKF